jgi:cytochrome c-550 PedF
MRHRIAPAFLISFIAASVWLAGSAWGHGDTVPQPVDTGKLPKLGADTWLTTDPFRTGEHREEALEVGARGYNANCARCHGLEAVSGGIAPDIRKLNADCAGDEACIKDMDGYFLDTVRGGRSRDGRVYMPPFEGILSQEAIWAIRTYVDSRPPPE